MEKIKKYLLLAFLIENIAAQTSLIGRASDFFFYAFLILGVFFAFTGTGFSNVSRNSFGWAFLLMILYLVFEFLVAPEYINQRTLLYVFAKIATFCIIIVSITADYKFYSEKAIYLLVLVMAFFIVYGLATGSGVGAESSGRMLLGYTNENTVGAMGALIVGLLFFYKKGRKWKKFDYLLVAIGLFGVLGGGSRSGMMMLFLLIFLRFGINIRTISVGIAFFVLGLFVLPNIGIETVGIQRLMNTLNGLEGNNREVEREATEWMIAQRPWKGWGFFAENQGYAESLTKLGSHNGYLDMLKFMGYPTTICWLLIVFYPIYTYFRTWRKRKTEMNSFFVIVVTLLFATMFEGLLTGVHEYETNLFFFALAMVSAYNYRIKNNLEV